MKIRRILLVLRNEIKLYIRLFRDKRTPKISKIMLIAAVIYLLSPIDLIPDFIPFAGFVDELIIIPLVFYISTLFIPKDVVEDNRRIIKGTQTDTKTKKFKDDEVQEGVIVD
jgi:uncharacterized membrane protein YkvA (DUF1232 family)